jgi:lysine N6-hydroxylase
MPARFSGLPSHRAFLADDLRVHIGELALDASAPVAVVGGGQTGLECVLSLMHAGMADIRWLGRGQWFQTIDDSPAANEFYRPAHQRFLQDLPRAVRRGLVAEQKPTNDALTPGALRELYQANYDRMLELGRFPALLLPGRDVVSGVTDGDQLVLHCSTSQGIEQHRVRHAVIATGREMVEVPFDAVLRGQIETDDDGEMILDRDYSVRWNGRNGHRIYAMNRGRMSHGIPDANLTLLPVRSATVLNSMFRRELFHINDEVTPVSWS